MNKFLVGFAIIGAILVAGSVYKMLPQKALLEEDLVAKAVFHDWKNTHQRQYSSLSEEQYRYGVFQSNMATVKELNALDDEVTLGASMFADLTSEEFQSQYLRAKPSTRDESKTEYLTVKDAPASLDWRKNGAVTSVKNQGMCGSCWAFSAAGALEGAYYLSQKKTDSLSVQQISDCCKEDGSQGCNGGEMTGAFKYVAKNGVEKWDDYTYTGRDQTCAYDKTKVLSDLQLTDYTDVPKSDSDQLLAYIQKQPVSIGIDANILQFYLFGVVNLLPCSTAVNHGILLVGYDTSYLGTPYWIMKNSWGWLWGERGYFRIRRDKGKGVGKCGITESATVPNVKGL